jgi:hypothetical protein
VLLAVLGPAWPSRTARAQPQASAATESALTVDIDVGSSGLDAEQLRAAIARELGVGVRLSGRDESSALRVRLGDGRRATVRFQPAGSPALERTVELPADAEPAYETVALLAGNLARNEASELLEQLRRKAPSQPEPAPGGAPTSEEPKPPPAATAPKPKPTPVKPTKTPNAERAPPRKRDEPQLKSAPVNLSVFHPLALYRDSHQRRVWLELGLFNSQVGAVDGVGLTLGYLRLRHELQGAIFSLFLNRVDGRTLGAQFSVGGNLSGGELRGADVAVGFNDRAGNVKGAQLAVGYNHAPAIEGAQLAVGYSGSDRLEGAQMGFVNWTDRGEGLQGGLVNVSGELSGVQLGLLNVGTHVRGTQIGLVNVADEVDGVSVGIVNVVGNARARVVGWVDSSAYGNVGIKYQHKYLFTLISGGYRLNRLTEPDGKLLEPGFAFGGHFDLGSAFAELDVQYAFRQANDEDAREKHFSRYRLTLGYDPVRAFGAFVGGALEQAFDRDGTTFGGLAFAGIQLF